MFSSAYYKIGDFALPREGQQYSGSGTKRLSQMHTKNSWKSCFLVAVCI